MKKKTSNVPMKEMKEAYNWFLEQHLKNQEKLKKIRERVNNERNDV